MQQLRRNHPAGIAVLVVALKGIAVLKPNIPSSSSIGGAFGRTPEPVVCIVHEIVALASDVAEKWLEGAAPRRVIVVPGKLVNLVP